MRRRIPADHLSLRLQLVEMNVDAAEALETAAFLEAEADMVAHWTPARWLEQGARWARMRSVASAGRQAELCEYVFGTLMPIALDPLERLELVVADQVAAAVLRAHVSRL